MTFVGREPELAELSRGRSEAEAGRGRLYLLSGEPGIGKTRLADEFALRASREGVPVAWGRSWEAGGAPAYWPWLEILATLAGMLDDAALETALGDGAGLVLDLVPAARARLPRVAAAAFDTGSARFRLFRAVAGLVRRASADRAIVLVLEDLHAADESSLSLLYYLSRELRGMRAFVLATFRDVEARLTPEVGEAIGRITREGTTLSLARLAEADVERFVKVRAGDVPAGTVSDLFRRTQGNPLFLEELVRWGPAKAGGAALPIGVREVIRERLSRVASGSRELLDVVAVVGDEAEPELVAEAAELPVTRVLAGLDEAMGAAVLAPGKSGKLRFSHALFREVLAQDLPLERGRAIHGRVAAALERRSAFRPDPPLAEIAHHLLEGPPGELPRAVDFATRSARRSLSLFAFEEAVAALERAREAVARAGDDPVLRARVLIALGTAHVARGAGAVGQELCLEAVEIARSLGDAEILSEAALAFSMEITAALVNPAVVALLEEAARALPEVDSPVRVRVLSRLAAALQPHRDLSYPIGIAREAIAAARRLGDPDTLLGALYTGMAAMMDIVDPLERLPMNLEIEQMAASVRDAEKLLRTQVRLVFDHMELGDFSAADARIDAFERLARETGAGRYLWRVPLFRSMRAIVHGRFGESEALLEEARALARSVDDPQLERCSVFHQEGLLRAWERHEDMIALDPEARRMRAALYSGSHWQNGGSAFTCSRIEDVERCRLYLSLVPSDDWPFVSNPPAFLHLGEPLALVGEMEPTERAYRLLYPARERFVSWGYTKFLWEGPAARVLGLLAARLGRLGDACAHFEDAEESLRRLGAGPFLARTRYEHARALLNGGGPTAADQARRLLSEAALAAEDLDMRGLRRLVARRLDSVAPAGRARASAPPLPAIEVVATAETAGLPFALVPEGEYWSVTFEGSTFRLKDSLGLSYLARLFAEPDRAIHVLELASGKAGAEGEPTIAGDAGELLDDRAKETYRQRVLDLRDQIAEAESFGDVERAARARAELEFLTAELARAVGLGGRSRRAGAATERARSAVQRRIRNAVERIRGSAPALAELIDATVKTGVLCLFSPKNAPRR